MSDRYANARLQEATGADWATWYERLDAHNGRTMDGTQISAWLRAHYGVSPWWSQMIKVEYEIHIGRRVAGQSHKGSFQVAATRTLAVSKDQAWQLLWESPMSPGEPSLQAAWDGEPLSWGELEGRSVQDAKNLRAWIHTNDGRVLLIGSIRPKGDKWVLGWQAEDLSNEADRELWRGRLKGHLSGLTL